MVEILFWMVVAVVFYTYVGYTLLLKMMVVVKKLITKARVPVFAHTPEVTVLIAAYNEKELVNDKVRNLNQLDYPKDKIHFLWVTDGSDDGTDTELQKYTNMQVLHRNERNGKIGALNRGMAYVQTPIVVFCDANNMLSENSIKSIVSYFADDKVGCVAGVKRIYNPQKDKAASAGEGIYWNYESVIKQLESDVYATIGAAGELFAIRTELFTNVAPDTILDDFIISLTIASKGYKIKYASDAIAYESGSVSIDEEMKRKVRIAAGSIQTLFRLKKLLNPLAYGILSWEYWSHKVLRWTFVPISIFVLVPLNIALLYSSQHIVYEVFMALQILFYMLVLTGYLLRNTSVSFRTLFAPYYLVVMNVSILLGMRKYFLGKQSVNWDKAKRAS